MKKIQTTLLFLLFLSLRTYAQHNAQPSDQFQVTGKIKNSFTISLAALDTMPVTNIGDIVITNHLGAVKDTARQLKGVLLKNILAHAVPENDPKSLGTVYITCTATDGYKVVFSWNELFNSDTGDHVYVITSREGHSLAQQKDRIAILSASDLHTGGRFLKGLSTITFSQAE